VSRTLFISDLHLDAARPATTQALADYLARNRACDALYILGDLFEAWPGDDDDSPLAIQVTAMLRNFSSAGPMLFIMGGNRDFLLGERFCRAAGARLLPDPTRLELYGTPTLLMHGDSLCTLDEEYQAFRRTSRDPHWQAEMLSRDLAERRELAVRMRTMSSEAKANKPEDIMDVTPAEVERVMRERDVEQLIHGHTHRPGRHLHATGARWVLGDWDSRAWELAVSAQSVKLNSFYISYSYN
jgi:UDP-2,3-diacylglucosamine hydrolase